MKRKKFRKVSRPEILCFIELKATQKVAEEKVCARPIDPSRNFQTKTVNQSISPSIKRQNAIKGRKELKITAARVIFCPVGFHSHPPILVLQFIHCFSDGARLDKSTYFSIFFKVKSNLELRLDPVAKNLQSLLHFFYIILF